METARKAAELVYPEIVAGPPFTPVRRKKISDNADGMQKKIVRPAQADSLRQRLKKLLCPPDQRAEDVNRAGPETHKRNSCVEGCRRGNCEGYLQHRRRPRNTEGGSPFLDNSFPI